MTDSTAIWKHEFTLKDLNRPQDGSIVDYLDIVLTEAGPNYLRASMPVDHRAKQSQGMLHGGVAVVLAETVGSIAGNLCVDWPTKHCVGLEVNANHLRAVRGGHVVATARPLHLGNSTHVWQIKIEDDKGRLVTASRLTLAVLDRQRFSNKG